MSDIKLHYFNYYARGEMIRMILHYHGDHFTDHRVTLEDFQGLKTSGLAEFGQLPVLEIDGLVLVQSRSIARYLCQKYGYYPNSLENNYWTESLLDFREDILNEYLRAKSSANSEQVEKLFEEKIPDWLRKAEARLERNNGGNGWFVGDNISLADFAVFQTVWDYMLCEAKVNRGGPLVASCAPKLRLWADRLLDSSASLRHYLETRQVLDC
mmetsp:Transcript_8865/g.8850  ORF Transcript_8865/g.8850 Transcript_8865/m.8850 type:complete len:212 (+) Transcript_8865:11-646(+)